MKTPSLEGLPTKAKEEDPSPYEMRLSKIILESVNTSVQSLFGDAGNMVTMQVKSSVTNDLYKHLYPQGYQPGIMYGLTKIHKPFVTVSLS